MSEFLDLSVYASYAHLHIEFFSFRHPIYVLSRKMLEHMPEPHDCFSSFKL